MKPTMSRSRAGPIAILTLVFGATLGPCSAPAAASAKPQAARPKILAQQLVEQVLREHPELAGLELSARSSRGCSTIAASAPKEIGQKCDRDELEAMRTERPFVEREGDGFDVTLPLRDTTGKIVGALGMDFPPRAGQRSPEVVEQAEKIARQLAPQIASGAKLFEPVP